MTFSQIENERWLDNARESLGFAPVKEEREEVPPVITTLKKQSYSFGMWMIDFTAIFLYYLFAGLTMLFRGKIPRTWSKPVKVKKQVIEVVSNVKEFTPLRKEAKKYGRVVDLDTIVPNKSLIN